MIELVKDGGELVPQWEIGESGHHEVDDVQYVPALKCQSRPAIGLPSAFQFRSSAGEPERPDGRINPVAAPHP